MAGKHFLNWQLIYTFPFPVIFKHQIYVKNDVKFMNVWYN